MNNPIEKQKKVLFVLPRRVSFFVRVNRTDGAEFCLGKQNGMVGILPRKLTKCSEIFIIKCMMTDGYAFVKYGESIGESYEGKE